ncbi:unannotated protein [freshwater metagenome]|uniref:Unannotated protein n=1 Tax=freshwater metagenome TaxID=449393 RepID=A0A6J7L253_9ZZZZ
MSETSPLLLPTAMRVVEVGMRDGLQSVRSTIATSDKVRLVESMIDAGVTEIEVVSFAHPKVLPQMADAEKLLASVPRVPGVSYRGLVPNARGAQRALDSGVDVITALTCTDPDVTMINQRRTHDQMWDELDEMVEICGSTPLTVAIVMSFFAYGTGVVSPEKLDAFVDRIVAAGVSSIYVADSAGLADPRQVHDALRRLRVRHPDLAIGIHLHTRGGFALANTLAALIAGVDWIEGAFCGLGGDLWLPGDNDVLGNLPTEDLVAMLQYMGVSTGVDLERYAQTVHLAESLTGIPTFGHFTRGGSRREMEEIVWSEILAQPGKEIPPTSS